MRADWDSEPRLYEQGVSQGIFYPGNSAGVPWNGLTSVTETGDASEESQYIDGQKYRNKVPDLDFAGTIVAFTYPDEFLPYDGFNGAASGQARDLFGLSYRTLHEIHLVYNVLVQPSSNAYSTVNDNATPIAFSWNFTTLPVDIPGGKSSAHLVVMTDYASQDAISNLEDIIYGSDTDDPRLPDPSEVLEIFESNTTVRITDNGDGTWTATGPDSAVSMTDSITFQINWPSAIFIDDTSYTISSL